MLLLSPPVRTAFLLGSRNRDRGVSASGTSRSFVSSGAAGCCRATPRQAGAMDDALG
jgi:hypothetical protein